MRSPDCKVRKVLSSVGKSWVISRSLDAIFVDGDYMLLALLTCDLEGQQLLLVQSDLSPSSRRKLLYTSLSHLNQILVPQLWQSFEGGTWLLQVTIGASMSRQACKTNPVQLSHSLIKTICYPNIFKISNDATEHGCKHEKEALAAYELTTKKRQVNFKVEECGLFVNLQYPLVACHARFPLQLWLLRWGVWWD